MNHRPVLVFRTSVHSSAELARLRPALEHSLDPSERWTLDLEDRDRVLRIEAQHTTSAAVMSLLEAHGHVCAELE